MNKHKKVALYLTVAALAFAIIAIFMGFAGGWTNGLMEDGKWVYDPITIKFWDIVFNKNNMVKDGFGGQTNAALIAMFVFTLISLLTLISLVVLNFTNKSNKKLNKSLMITLAVILIITALLAVSSKAVCGVADESWTTGSTRRIVNKLAAGPICWAVFSFLAGVSMIIAAVFNKKAFALKA